FVALKGLAHPGSARTPACSLETSLEAARVQYDVDLYLPRTTVAEGQRLLIADGWAPAKAMESFPTDHLPVLLRENPGWEWGGDYFDPGLPVAIELHF